MIIQMIRRKGNEKEDRLYLFRKRDVERSELDGKVRSIRRRSRLISGMKYVKER